MGKEGEINKDLAISDTLAIGHFVLTDMNSVTGKTMSQSGGTFQSRHLAIKDNCR